MGATTFYLLELEKKQKEQLKKQNQEKQVNEVRVEEENIKINCSELKKDEIKAILKGKGIPYDEKAKKEELIKLLEEVQ